MNKTNKLKEFIKKLVKEYTGTGASGGNATDGNNITSPRPFADDMEEMENYILKNIYGGEGGQTVGDMYTGNYPNRHPQGMFEDKVKKYIKNEIRKYYGVHDTFGVSSGQTRNISGRPGVWEQVNEQMSAAKQAEFQDRKINLQQALAQVDIDMTREQLRGIAAAYQQQMAQTGEQISAVEEQIAAAVTEKTEQFQDLRDLKADLSELEEMEDLPDETKNKRKEEINNAIKAKRDNIKATENKLDQLGQQKTQIFNSRNTAASANAKQQAQIKRQVTNMKKNKNAIGKAKVREYFKDTQSNLMDRMDTYRKEAKRTILMEGAMKKFFEMFDSGMTNEEIIQDYASKGTQVPETFVGNARKQYENYKKMKLELDISEKEFKNSAREMVNNPDDSPTEGEEKQLASGIFREYNLKKESELRKNIREILTN